MDGALFADGGVDPAQTGIGLLLAVLLIPALRVFVPAMPPLWLGSGALAVLSLGGWASAVVPPPWVPASLLLAWGLVMLALIDARSRRLPDALTLPLALAGLGVSAVATPGEWSDHAVGAVAGYAGLVGIAAFYRWLFGREGIGRGDAKLLAAAGAWLGWAALPGVVVMASLAALAVLAPVDVLGRRAAVRAGSDGARIAYPFGPWLCGAIWWVWLYGP